MAVSRRVAAGDVVAGYEVGALAGRGGMGEVYRAHDPRLERPVALKLLSERLSDDDGFRERMLKESRLAASLDHPNVVPIYEAGEAEGRLFIAMRYVDGTDLEALLRREGALAPERAVAIAAQVADALDAAHAKGLVHRDVKPSNVLLDQQGGREHAYLADFGLTQSIAEAGPADGSLMGTLDYVAPEQIRGDQVDGRADVYALGCLLFETLTGPCRSPGRPTSRSSTPTWRRRLRARASAARAFLQRSTTFSPGPWPRTRTSGRRAAAHSSTRREQHSASRNHDRQPGGALRSSPSWRPASRPRRRRPWSSRPETTAPRPRRQGGRSCGSTPPPIA